MILSANTFDGVLRALGADPASLSEPDGQRRAPRVSLGGRVVIVPCPEGVGGAHAAPQSVPMRDLSRGGVRLLMPRRLPLDTQFVLILPRSPEAPVKAAGDAMAARNQSTSAPAPLAVECTVIYWQPLARELFAIGGQFTRVLSAAEFQVPAQPARLVLPGHAAGDPGAELAETPVGEALRRAAV